MLLVAVGYVVMVRRALFSAVLSSHRFTWSLMSAVVLMSLHVMLWHQYSAGKSFVALLILLSLVGVIVCCAFFLYPAAKSVRNQL